MSSTEIGDDLVAGAVQWWLEKEASASTFNNNSPLDNLNLMQQTLIDRKDPKIDGHIDRMEVWLSQYDNPNLRPQESEGLVANIAYGSLMFLSGNYRRQRIIQSTSQEDYFRRKLNWTHPYGVPIVAYLPSCLRRDRLIGANAEDVIEQGVMSLGATQASFEIIYERAPRDFGIEFSDSVEAISQEQEGWLTFLSKLLTHASAKTGLVLEEVPIREPTTITEAQLTTLVELMSLKTK